MKNRSLFLTLVSKMSKIYFSDISNKEHAYKKTIFYTLKDMGGVYIKFLQILCVTQNFTDGWAGPKEFSVFNQVDNEVLDVHKIIEHQEQYFHIDKEPFAGGSFAQLYKGKLKTGEDVAIKILRPSIAYELKNDLVKLKKLVKIMSYFLPANMINYNEAFAEFSYNCLLETDYEREIANMEYFANMYKDSEYVIIPKVYKNISSKYVIVQEFIDGPTLSELVTSIKTGDSLADYAFSRTGSDVWFQMMIAGAEALRSAMMEDYVFGDPHPGNIILLKDNKIAFVDFGIIANKPTSQEAFYLWTKAYRDVLLGGNDYGKLVETTCSCFCPDLVNALKKCSINLRGSKDFMALLADALNVKLDSVMDNNDAASKLIQGGHLFRLFTKFVDGKNALNLKLDMNNFQLLKATQSYLSSVTMIDNRYGNNNFPKMMLDAMEYALRECEAAGVKKDLIDTTKYSVNESYELLLDTLTSLAEGDEILFQNISEGMF